MGCYVHNKGISKLFLTKNNSKYLIRYLDIIRTLVLVLPKISKYVKKFKMIKMKKQ